jgi:hypothetical protein
MAGKGHHVNYFSDLISIAREIPLCRFRIEISEKNIFTYVAVSEKIKSRAMVLEK